MLGSVRCIQTLLAVQKSGCGKLLQCCFQAILGGSRDAWGCEQAAGGESGAGAVAGQFALVEEGDSQEGGPEDEEREDAIGAVEEGEVVEEDFDDDDAEEEEGLPAKERQLALNAEEEQKTGIGGPENGDGEMLGQGVV